MSATLPPDLACYFAELGRKGGQASGRALRELRERIATGTASPQEVAEYERRRERLRVTGRLGGLATAAKRR